MNRTHVTGALGLGVGGLSVLAGANFANRDSTDAEENAGGPRRDGTAVRHDVGDVHHHHPDLALVFAYDYYPGLVFTPVDRVPQETVDAILGGRTADRDPLVSDLDQYYGYVVQYRREWSVAGEYTFVFVHEQILRNDEQYRFGTDATVFDERTRLLRTGIRPTDDDAEENVGESTTPRDETTHEVIVNTENATATVDGES